tara:strand:+ start:162 stop:722 length:561 start_codon:yes stop_codon:yes gene_type:complete
MKESVKAILDFWFVESSLEDLFKRSKDFDQKIRNRFMSDYENAIDNQYEDWQDDPESCLALIILLDQFSRNLFRDDKQAFAQDYKARLITNEAVDRGYLEGIGLDQKHFMLLPLLHSEDISDHVYVQNLCGTYLKKHPQFNEIKKAWDDHTYAIKKFGRYPHRNKILGRTSTPEEELFLQKPNSSW